MKVSRFLFFLLLGFLISCQETTELMTNMPDDQEINGFVKPGGGMIGINIVLNTEIDQRIIQELNRYGRVVDLFYEIDAVRLLAKADQLDKIQALRYVESANPDAERTGSPVDMVGVDNFADGMSTWNLDAINVTDFGLERRVVEQDGSGVYVGILDTGLLDSWRKYFPQERIAVEYAKSFGGGGAAGMNVSEQPNKWEHDTNSHGTHVTSTVLGFNLRGIPVNGVAPKAAVIPVKVLNQNGSGWSSVITQGILYMTELKKGPLADSPVVINMSLGGGALDAMEQKAIDAAIEAGVIIVASAGNSGMRGMGYPGAYAPVISVAASGWNELFVSQGWTGNVFDPTNPDDFYISNFSSRQIDEQDLDVTAPGSWIVGPYQLQSGKTSYYYLSGTSMASPHVAGLVALMAQKDPTLSAVDAENLLEATALFLPAFTPADQGAGMVDAVAVLSAM